jgi:sugar lactone lactonase YvrE
MTVSPSIALRIAAATCAVLIAGCSRAPDPASEATSAGSASATTRVPGDVRIDDRDPYSESVTSTAAGDLITGSLKGVIFRAAPDSAVATAWVQPDETNGLQAVFGVLAHEPSGTLWVCSVPNPFQAPAEGRVSEVIALDLATGVLRSRHPFPSPGVCNDITVGPDGSVYAADTPNGRVLKLAPGASDLSVWGEDAVLKGIDGIAFGADGTLYANNVQANTLVRLEVDGDRMGKVVTLEIAEQLAGPDGMRLIDGNRFLLAEGNNGRVSEVTIDGDRATMRVLSTKLASSPGVTLIGDTAYALEGKIGYLVNPDLRGQDPGEFRIVAIPMSGETAQ